MKKVLLMMLGVLIALPGVSRDFTYEYEGQTLTYTVLDEEAKTCMTKEGSMSMAGNSVSGALVIPAVAKDGDVEYAVTEIGFNAFYGCSLTSVIIPSSVTEIGFSAFGYCTGLTSVIIPSSVTKIDYGAFCGCTGLTSVIIPSSVTEIGPYAFCDCSNLTSVIIPSSVTEIGYGVFCYTGLTSVIIPSSVTEIGSYAFYECSNLTSVIIPSSVTEIGPKAFYGCSNLKKSAYPSGLSNPFTDGVAIEYPREGAIIEDGFIFGPEKNAIYFAPLSLEGEYVIPESVTEIGNNAFNLCSGITTVKATNMTPPVMPDTAFDGLYDTALLSVPEGAVNNYLATNWSLFKNVRIGDIGETLGTYETGNLKYMLIPGKTDADNNLAVVIPGEYSSLTEVTIPERITVSDNGSNSRYYVDGIGFKAFNGCSKLATVTFNSRNASRVIGNYAFAGTQISALTIPETVEAIGPHAFDGCNSLTGIVIPGSVGTIGDYAFYNTSALKEVTLNEGLESIGEKCFSASIDRRIEPIYIPSTLTSVGMDAFLNFNCQYVNISDLTAWCNIDFDNDNSNPAAHRQGLYLNGEKIENLVISESVNAIKDYAFCYNSTLKSVTFNEVLQSIGAKAFMGCRGLYTAVIPGNVGTIGDYAFNGCTAMTNANLEAGVEAIGPHAFDGCMSLTGIVIPGSVTAIGDNAFVNTNVENLTLAYGTEQIEIGSNAFPNLTRLSCDRPLEGLNLSLNSLESLTIGNSVTEIPATEFKGISSLADLTLGNNLIAIGDEAFSSCTALTEVILPPSVETIGASAFAGNTQLTSIIMGHNVKSIGEKAFDLCPAQTVSVTAQTPPAAADNTFSNYTGTLYVQGKDAVEAYYDTDYCWFQFEGHVMIEPTELKVEGEKTLTGKPGDTFQLTATLYPENVTLPQIFWRSTNPEIATVDANGLVTLHADMSEMMAMAEGDDDSATSCKIIAESLYANGPVAEVTVNNDNSSVDIIVGGGSDDSNGNIDYNAPVEVYNLQGMKISDTIENLNHGVYIVRQGKNVKKIAVK